MQIATVNGGSDSAPSRLHYDGDDDDDDASKHEAVETPLSLDGDGNRRFDAVC